ncbi:MAG: bile acid:sodium symporter family protein [archaeon]|nr:bile acid:sodium symporter family protein [archaeon]
MNLKQISDVFEKYMLIVIVIAAIISFINPNSFNWIDVNYVNYFLMILMFSMGLTIEFDDFVVVFKKPKYIAVGIIAQFTLMPILAFIIGSLLNLEIGLLVGLVLVGTCPGGTASNVITYLSGGDTALSIGMTTVNTILATVLTPLISFIILKTTVDVDILSLFISIVQIVIIPLVLGFIINRYFKRFVEKVRDILPTIAITSIAIIVILVISHTADKLLTMGLIVLVAVIALNLLGHICGFALGKILGFPLDKIKTIAIELAMQNSGLATALATTSFPNLAMATVPGAMYSIWQNLFGTVVAYIFKKMR